MEDFISKLPFVLASLMGLIIGTFGFICGNDNYFIYTSMLISILAFGVIGYVVKKVIMNIIEDKEKLNIKSKKTEEISIEEDEKGSVIDLRVDDSSNPQINNFYGEDFSPLEVSKVIRTNIANE